MEVSESGLLVFIRNCDEGLHHMTNEELVELDLQHGLNKARCVIEGDIVIKFNLFLYNEGEKVVISDVDGTITESDIKVKKCHFLEILCLFDDLSYECVLGTYLDSIGSCQSANIRCPTF